MVINRVSKFHEFSSNPATLYIIATPIGNLEDITLRALKVLKSVDFIACENPKNTLKLLQHYDIKTKCIQYNDHSTPKERNKIIALLEGGKSIALISDAGTPLISDPGYKLVQEAREHGIHITSIPGASSLITALTLSGMPTDQFSYLGFLSASHVARVKEINEVRHIKSPLIFFESPRRLKETLNDMLKVLGDRNAVVARELTKMYEEVKPAKISELIEIYSADVKGEIVLIVEGYKEEELSDHEIQELLIALLKENSLKDSVKEIAENYKIPRKRVYNIAINLKI